MHELKQICVIEVHGNPRYPDAPAIPLTVLINPVVTPLTEEMEDGWEGCLSVPDMRGMVPRLTLRCGSRPATARAGRSTWWPRSSSPGSSSTRPTTCTGMVYLDRMRDLSTLTHLAEWNRYWLGNQEQDD